MSSSTPWLGYIERNQIPLTRNVLCLLYAAHFLGGRILPRVPHYTFKFMHLQYLVEHDGEPQYDIGAGDAYYVAYWVFLLTFFRLFLMQWVFEPCAKHVCHIRLKKAKTRFAEQSWMALYYSLSFCAGWRIYRSLPYFKSLDHLYLGWPHDRMGGFFKKYYLVLMAFWLQQVLVLNIEKRRKDHFQMFSHHLITCALIIGLYYYYYTRVGNLILMIMDLVDVFLSSAKILRYLGFYTLCDAMFVVFLVLWIVLRHGVYNVILMHAWTAAKGLMPDSQCVEGAVQTRCWTNLVVRVFLSLLAGLQVITLVWMVLIAKVAYRVVTGNGAEDVRSDDDTEEEK